jgi:hypothetical protein
MLHTLALQSIVFIWREKFPAVIEEFRAIQVGKNNLSS